MSSPCYLNYCPHNLIFRNCLGAFMETHKMTELQQVNVFIPVLPLRDVVVYPHMVIPLFVGRERSIDALDAAMKDNKQVLLVAHERQRLMNQILVTFMKLVH